MTTDNNSVCEDANNLAESSEDLERNIQRRKGYRSFLEVLIASCIIATGIIMALIAFPLPTEIIDPGLSLFISLELVLFLPFVNLFGMILTISGLNKKEYSDLIKRLLILFGSYVVLWNVFVAYLLKLLR